MAGYYFLTKLWLVIVFYITLLQARTRGYFSITEAKSIGSWWDLGLGSRGPVTSTTRPARSPEKGQIGHSTEPLSEMCLIENDSSPHKIQGAINEINMDNVPTI